MPSPNWGVAQARDIRYKEVLALRTGPLKSDGTDRDEAIRSLIGRPIRSTKALQEWHDLLLFILAYPISAAEHRTARIELARVIELVERGVERSEKQAYALINSGIQGTSLQSSFSLEIVRWLVMRWPTAVDVLSMDCDPDQLRDVVRNALARGEREALDQPFAYTEGLLGSVIGDGDRVNRVIAMLDRIPCSDELRAMLFDRLKVYIRVSGKAKGLSTSSIRGPAHPLFIHRDGLLRSVDPSRSMGRPLPPPVRLGPVQRKALIDAARAMLCSQNRETDPVTHAGHVELFDMGRGLRIALFTMRPQHRLPYESYIGSMAFKNGMPMAYGGAWIFPGRSKIGMNVFPAYRGGESAWFFAQLLRLYSQRYDVERFEAENYQLGHDNPEGLRSGAYWFYYRSGFRPTDARMAKIAAKHFADLKRVKDHNVPLGTLRELVAGGLELVVSPTDLLVTDTARITIAVQQHIISAHGADRSKAIARSLEDLRLHIPWEPIDEWLPDERACLEDWALLAHAAGGMAEWTKKRKRAFVSMIRAKAARTERDHQKALRHHPELLEAAYRLTSEQSLS